MNDETQEEEIAVDDDVVLTGLQHLAEHVQEAGVDIGFPDIDIEGLEILQETLENDARALGTYIKILKRRAAI